MSLIALHRSPSPTDEEAVASDSETTDEGRRTTNSSSAGTKRSPSECYFTVRGAAVMLSHSDQASVSPRHPDQSATNNEIEAHLQSMLRILRPEDTLLMAVRLQSCTENHAKYVAVISTIDHETDLHESALLGFDFLPTDEKASIGVALPIRISYQVELDGDGGITVHSKSSSYLFKPISIQSMWSLFQLLHKELKISSKAKLGCISPFSNHQWLNYYQGYLTKEDSISVQWQFSMIDDAAKGDIKASTVPSGLSNRTDREMESESRIRSHLKQIMQSVDLDAVTSKDIRMRLEEQMGVKNLSDFKDFIDSEMLVILGQMDKPSQIFDYLYLGTEWNASNWEELKANKVEYILNVTKEVDIFFPNSFKYLKVWVADEATTELLVHWQRTYDFLKDAKERGSRVLVHCKKGISRSSSTVIAYAMKEYGWSLESSLNFVKEKRNCITPNSGFMLQLTTFDHILKASSNRHSAIFNATALTGSANSNISDGKSSRSSSSPTMSLAGGDQTMLKLQNEIKETEHIKRSNNVSINEGSSPKTSTALKSSAVQEAISNMESHCKEQNSCDVEKTNVKNAGTRSSSNIARAKCFFATKQSPTTDNSALNKSFGSAVAIGSNVRVGSGRVKQQRENFESRVKNTKGRAHCSLVSSIAKGISRLSLVGRYDKTQCEKQAFIPVRQRCRMKAFNSRSETETIQQEQLVKTLVSKFEQKTELKECKQVSVDE
ncbi:dual specificity phosphatase, catalytic domain-containing protein [Ditylenchus destructor]|uniref:protein-serine/threonine phosphatase n=1 Tax=Ditylenchus destructor TaxID=166010 RepID=A0AAD4MVU3_9BILA|nr:dual specificity phosphatase, catalytic domain-containing protein [Ditylenchus destructor]